MDYRGNTRHSVTPPRPGGVDDGTVGGSNAHRLHDNFSGKRADRRLHRQTNLRASPLIRQGKRCSPFTVFSLPPSGSGTAALDGLSAWPRPALACVLLCRTPGRIVPPGSFTSLTTIHPVPPTMHSGSFGSDPACFCVPRPRTGSNEKTRCTSIP
jgi:hypothetical protein